MRFVRLAAFFAVILFVAAAAAFGVWVTPTGKPDDLQGRYGTFVRALFGLPPRTTAVVSTQGDLPAVVAPPPKAKAADKEENDKATDLGTPHATIAWRMTACKNAPGCNENGFSKTCAEVGVKRLRFVIENEHTLEIKTTHAECPANQSQGEVTVDVPAGDGPWTLTAASDDVPSARTEVVCHMTPGCWKRNFSLNIYARGCMDPECTSCLEGTHVKGWCE